VEGVALLLAEQVRGEDDPVHDGARIGDVGEADVVPVLVQPQSGLAFGEAHEVML
jgi:hypothetical protein